MLHNVFVQSVTKRFAPQLRQPRWLPPGLPEGALVVVGPAIAPTHWIVRLRGERERSTCYTSRRIVREMKQKTVSYPIAVLFQNTSK